MTSPFAGFDNATLTFKVSDGTYTTNAAGNRSPNTTNVVISAVLKTKSDQGAITRYAQEIQQFAGADGHADLLEGYLVDPKTYPAGVEFLAEADAEITTAIGRTEAGRFKLLPVVQSPYVVALGIEMITPIRGVFRRN